MKETWRGSFLSVDPSISFTKIWRSSGLPKVRHFSTTFEANFCRLIWTICPANSLTIADRSWGFPCSNTCCQKINLNQRKNTSTQNKDCKCHIRSTKQLSRSNTSCYDTRYSRHSTSFRIFCEEQYQSCHLMPYGFLSMVVKGVVKLYYIWKLSF